MLRNQTVETRTIEKVLDSTLGSVDRAEEAVLREALQLGFNDDELHKIGMSVRECVVNAVVHGNRYGARKKVQLTISRTPDCLVVMVADEGAGFDTVSVRDPLADGHLLSPSGRGLMMMRTFMDELQIRRRQPKGTEVKMLKYVAKAK